MLPKPPEISGPRLEAPFAAIVRASSSRSGPKRSSG
jgi:hypothetical protein